MDFSSCLTGNLKAYLKSIKEWAESIWINPPVLPFYTKRGIAQANRFINRLEGICDLVKPSLSQEELFVLIASIYLHDIGLYSGFNLIERFENKARDKLNDEDLHKIVESHPLISERLIQANKNNPPFYNYKITVSDELYLVDIISFVCSKHKGYLEMGGLKKEIKKKFPSSVKIRIDLITALLQLADVLDMAKDRLNKEKFDDMVNSKIELPPHIEMRWWCFYYVKEVVINSLPAIEIIYEIPTKLEPLFYLIMIKIEERLLRKEGDCLDILKHYGINFVIIKNLPPIICNDNICLPNEILSHF